MSHECTPICAHRRWEVVKVNMSISVDMNCAWTRPGREARRALARDGVPRLVCHDLTLPIFFSLVIMETTLANMQVDQSDSKTVNTQ